MLKVTELSCDVLSSLTALLSGYAANVFGLTPEHKNSAHVFCCALIEYKIACIFRSEERLFENFISDTTLAMYKMIT